MWFWSHSTDFLTPRQDAFVSEMHTINEKRASRKRTSHHINKRYVHKCKSEMVDCLSCFGQLACNNSEPAKWPSGVAKSNRHGLHKHNVQLICSVRTPTVNSIFVMTTLARFFLFKSTTLIAPNCSKGSAEFPSNVRKIKLETA